VSDLLELVHEAPRAQARNAPALLFAHGAYCGAWCWQPFMRWFADLGYDCYAFSFEGHAGSAGHDYLAAIRIDDFRHNLQAIVERLPVPPVVIAHSMGGFVLQQYLVQQSLPGAVFLASVPPTGMAAPTLRLMASAPSLLLKLNLFQNGHHGPDLDELRTLLFSSDAPDETLELAIRRCQPESERAVMDMALVNPLGIGQPQPTPSLVLGAADDRLISPEDVVATARLMNSRAEILPGFGHMMMLDTRWQTCATRIQEWLEQRFG
jgi:pimeloyl-ACP methyl ester carboxylesterase